MRREEGEAFDKKMMYALIRANIKAASIRRLPAISAYFIYKLIKRNVPCLNFAFLPPTDLEQPMHSQSALTELPSPNLAPFFCSTLSCKLKMSGRCQVISEDEWQDNGREDI